MTSTNSTNRKKNLVFTISQNYSDVRTDSFSDESEYKLSVLAMAQRVYDKNSLLKFMQYVDGKNNYKDLRTIMALSAENAIRDILFKKRPGTEDFFLDFIKNLKHKYDFLEPSSISEELERAYYSEYLKRPEIVNGSLKDLLGEIRNFKSIDTYEFLKFLKATFQKYFHTYDSLPESEEVERLIERVKTKKIINPTIVDVRDVEISDLEKFTIESAEFTQSIYEDLKEVLDTPSISSGAKDYSPIIKRRYGKQIMRENEVKKLEEKLSTGIHHDVKLYFTKGEYETSDSFFEAEAKNAHQKNLLTFREDELHYRRAAINLKETLKNSLLKDSHSDTTLSSTGELVASDVWRSLYSNNKKIFKRTHSEDLGDISVDILLDASASQNTRQSEVAIEAFIIAEALTSLNIDTRVMSFNNFFDHMIIKTYRDYHDPKNKNLDIFKFQASGSNRDGLAIKLMSHLIDKNSYNRKFLIILSDGKPNDETDLGLVGMADFGIENYTDEVATFDSFNSVMKARLLGINVLGVFTGFEEDLETEKKIFGSDFSYITDIKRFHSIVGIFFKAIASKIY